MGANGKWVRVNSASGVTVTLSNNLEEGFSCGFSQMGAGQVTFSAQAGGTLLNRQSHTKTAGQNAPVSILVVANTTGTAAQLLLGGDTTT
jgi:hypothetical protein